MNKAIIKDIVVAIIVGICAVIITIKWIEFDDKEDCIINTAEDGLLE